MIFALFNSTTIMPETQILLCAKKKDLLLSIKTKKPAQYQAGFPNLLNENTFTIFTSSKNHYKL